MHYVDTANSNQQNFEEKGSQITNQLELKAINL